MIPAHVRIGMTVAILIAVLDQASKWWVVETVMLPPRVIPVTDFFNLVLGLNRGISFGMLDMQSPMGRWILSSLAIAITAALLVWMWRADKRLVAGALGLIVGGALGNVIDRVLIPRSLYKGAARQSLPHPSQCLVTDMDSSWRR